MPAKFIIATKEDTILVEFVGTEKRIDQFTKADARD